MSNAHSSNFLGGEESELDFLDCLERRKRVPVKVETRHVCKLDFLGFLDFILSTTLRATEMRRTSAGVERCRWARWTRCAV